MPHTLLSQPSHSPEKERIPARKHRGIGQGQGAASSSACSSPHSSGAASTVSPQVLLEDTPATFHWFSLSLDASDNIVSTLRWQQTSKPASSIY